jgi:hypothetical protein
MENNDEYVNENRETIDIGDCHYDSQLFRSEYNPENNNYHLYNKDKNFNSILNYKKMIIYISNGELMNKRKISNSLLRKRNIGKYIMRL